MKSLSLTVWFVCSLGAVLAISAPAVFAQNVPSGEILASNRVSVSISPPLASLKTGQSQTFTATVTGALNTNVTWSLAPPVGTLSSSGVYTAPASLAAPQTVTVTATSVVDKKKFANASVTVTGGPLTVSPSNVRLHGGGTQQFGAFNSSGSAVSAAWSVDIGVITSAGIYTAPASVTTAATAAVKATAPDGGVGTTALSLVPPVTTAITPSTGGTLSAGQSRQFWAATSNAIQNLGVVWSLAGIGTITQDGIYTAPATIYGNQNVTLTATPVETPNTPASVVVALTGNATPTVTVSPATSSHHPGETQQFIATAAGLSGNAVTWSTDKGAINSAGLFTAPSVTSTQIATVKATSVSDPSISGAASVTLVPPATVSVSPATASVNTGQSAQFTAAVTNSLYTTAVTWTLSPAVGAVSATGLYTAPASVNGAQTVTLTATSTENPASSASAIVTIASGVLTVSPASIRVHGGATQQFWAFNSSGSAVSASWSADIGVIDAAGFYTAPASVAIAANATARATAADGRTGAATVALVPPVTTAITPSTGGTLSAGQSRQFWAATTNTIQNSSVVWSVAGIGTITQDGIYTAPSTIAGNQNVTLTATPVETPNTPASVVIALTAGVTGTSIVVSPATASLHPGQTQQFSATLTGFPSTSVTWSASTGVITSGGLYTAPSVASTQTATIQATSVSDPASSATATVTLVPPATVTVSPAAASVAAGQSIQITAVVSNALSSTAVTWTLNPSFGALNNGLYTAPASVSASQLVTVTATSVENPASSSSASLTVGPSGSGTGTTITVPAGGDFQAALNQANPGDTIVLQAGATYSSNFTLPNKSGAGYITIQSSALASLPPDGQRVSPADAPNMPKIVTPNAMAAITADTAAHNYKFIGIEFTGPAGVYTQGFVVLGDINATTTNALPVAIELYRVYIHGDPTAGAKRGIDLHVIGGIVKDSYIGTIMSNFQDAQAILVCNTPGPIQIVNNYLEASGENFMSGGCTDGIPSILPSNITVTRNYFFKPTSWQSAAWVVKNSFELKNAASVNIQGNIFQNNWVSGQAGYMIVFTPRSDNHDASGAPYGVIQDVTFANNQLINSPQGINILGQDNVTLGGTSYAKNITIKNNVMTNVAGNLVYIQLGPQYLTIDHNTGFPTNTMLYADNTTNNLVMTNNNLASGMYGIFGSGLSPGNLTINTNLPGAQIAGNIFIGAPSAYYPVNNYYPGSTADVGFVDYAGGNYALAATSPYKGKALDGADPGADFTVLTNAIGNAQTGR